MVTLYHIKNDFQYIYITRNPSVDVRLLLSHSIVTLAASNTKTTKELEQCMIDFSDL